MEPTKLLEQLFDKKKMNVIKQFLAQPEREWTLVEVAKSARVPNATTYRILNKLLELELIAETKIKHLKTYRLSDSSTAKYLGKILETGDSALDAFAELIKSVAGVQQVVMHGKQSKEKANVLVIGNSVDSALVNATAQKVQEQFKFTIITLVLAPQQYEQMVSMGLYPGTKQVIYVAE